MHIIGIETSCDETAVSIIRASDNNHDADISVLASEVSSQIAVHAPFGGVVPSIAKYEHETNLPTVLAQAFEKAKVSWADIDVIAATAGPGLAPALGVGFKFAKAEAVARNIPLVPVNHVEGHVYSVWLEDKNREVLRNASFPILFLIVSGGHTQLALMEKYGMYKILGTTLDDAVGESFDKVAKILGIGYPGGPKVSAYAKKGNRKAFEFPRPMLKHSGFDFSYAGLKTAVLYEVRGAQLGRIADGAVEQYSEQYISDICASFEEAAVEVLVEKTIRAVKEFLPKAVAIVGGVSANKRLSEMMRERLSADIPPVIPSSEWTGDNAAMIALAGWHRWIDGAYPDPQTADIRARWPITDIASKS